MSTVTDDGGVEPGLDAYDTHARLLPALVAVLPATAAAAVALGLGSAWIGAAISAVGVPLVVGVLLSGLARQAGLKAQERIWTADGASPVVLLLRWSRDDPAGVGHRHLIVERLTGRPLPSPDDEGRDPKAADGRYRVAESELRRTALEHGSRRVERALREYGFVRNLRGLRSLMVGAAVVGAALSVWAFVAAGTGTAKVTASLVGVAVVGGTALVARTFDDDAVRRAGAAYATTLLDLAAGLGDRPPDPGDGRWRDGTPTGSKPGPVWDDDLFGPDDPAAWPSAWDDAGSEVRGAVPPPPPSARPPGRVPPPPPGIPSRRRGRPPAPGPVASTPPLPADGSAGAAAYPLGPRTPRGVGPPSRFLAQQVLLDGTELASGFVRGRTHQVRIDIGPLVARSATRGFPEPAEPTPDRTLLVRFSASPVQEEMITLPSDREDRSDAAVFAVEVAEDQLVVEAIVGVYDAAQPSRLLQGATLSGPVVDDLATAERVGPGGLRFDVNPVAADPADASTSSVQASVHVAGGSGVASTDVDAESLSIDRSALAGLLDQVAQGVVTGAAEMLVPGGDADAALGRLMFNLASNGRRIREEFPFLLDPGHPFARARHLQVVGAGPGDLLPLEFVYDGPPPMIGATLCPEWQLALEAGTCVTCADLDPDEEAAWVCPLGFWSLTRVVERHGGVAKDDRFEVRVQPTKDACTLPALHGALVGGSSQFAATVLEEARAKVAGQFAPAVLGADWTAWRLAVERARPSLLVSMPHLDVVPGTSPEVPALEIGGSLVALGALVRTHVHVDGDRPGPLVLLIGCNTGADGGALASFSSSFRNHGASVVVSSVGQVVTQQAPDVVACLVDALAAAARRPGSTVGEAVVETRRKLLARRNAMGMLLVAHGDADWRLS